MNLSEILKGATKVKLNQREVVNLTRFLQANLEQTEFWQVNEWSGETYVILKWPHKVPDLTVLP